MRDPLTRPPTTLFTPREPNVTEWPTGPSGRPQAVLPRRCPLPVARLAILGFVPIPNLEPQTSRIDRYTCRTKRRSDEDRRPACPDAGRERSNACPPRRAQRGNSPCPIEWYSAQSRSRIDRYTCRTKIAVSPSTSSKLPNLIDTLLDPAQPCRIVLHLAVAGENLGSWPVRTSNFEPLTSEISRHVCREIFRVSPIASTKPPKYLGTFFSAEKVNNASKNCRAATCGEVKS